MDARGLQIHYHRGVKGLVIQTFTKELFFSTGDKIKDLAARAKEVDEFVVDNVCVHTGYDLQAVGKKSTAQKIHELIKRG